jgi:hypothetical protein
MPSAGFEPVTTATKRPQTYALDRAATEVDQLVPKTANIFAAPFIFRSLNFHSFLSFSPFRVFSFQILSLFPCFTYFCFPTPSCITAVINHKTNDRRPCALSSAANILHKSNLI